MERVIYGSSAMTVTPQQRTMGQAGRYEGELDARKRACPVRWRGKALSSPDDMLIPLSFKWNRHCAYCGKNDVLLQVEHIHPRAKGGTNRVSNLTLACEPCNQAKGTQDIHDFLARKPDVLKRVVAQAKAPLKDAAAVNATRWALYHRLHALGLPVECGSGGRTKYNRTTWELPKEHWLDAVCVGKSTPACLKVTGVVPLLIKATGHGNRRMCGIDNYGFPKQHRHRRKHAFGYQTGDMVKAVIPIGKYQGTYEGCITIRHRPSFRLGTFDVHPKYLRSIQKADGYGYRIGGNSSRP